MRPPHGLVVVGAKGAWPSGKQVKIFLKGPPTLLTRNPSRSRSRSRSRSLRLGRGHRGGDGLRSVLDYHGRAHGSALVRVARGGGSALEREAHSSDSCLTRQIRGSACDLLEARGRGTALVIVVRGWGDCLAFKA